MDGTSSPLCYHSTQSLSQPDYGGMRGASDYFHSVKFHPNHPSIQLLLTEFRLRKSENVEPMILAGLVTGGQPCGPIEKREQHAFDTERTERDVERKSPKSE
uniref:Uncharacterized protein n=1 Tax=Trichuris muris TaxID=70415 RepID=A0A5S6QSL2_TRIMR